MMARACLYQAWELCPEPVHPKTVEQHHAEERAGPACSRLEQNQILSVSTSHLVSVLDSHPEVPGLPKWGRAPYPLSSHLRSLFWASGVLLTAPCRPVSDVGESQWALKVSWNHILAACVKVGMRSGFCPSVTADKYLRVASYRTRSTSA